VLHLEDLCCTCTCLSTDGRVYLQEPSPCCTVPVGVRFTILFVSVCCETKQYVSFGCFDTFSKNGNKTETNLKNIFGFHETKPKTIETDYISVVFSSNRKYVFVCFEDTLSTIGFFGLFWINKQQIEGVGLCENL
jgi:hypothetical protein